MPSTYLYAEFLSNIRQVTLFASLESYRNKDTKIELSSGRKSLSLSHEGETTTILLPNAIAGSAELTVPVQHTKELSFRLQVAEAIDPRTITTTDNEVPWSADALEQSTQVRCRNCQNPIIEPNTIHSWKDLPSEHWAEMMDFWHCHKPHDHQTHNGEENSGKGYGASTKVTAESGIGLVDISSFLFAEKDCHGVQTSPNGKFNGSVVVECNTCQSMLGIMDIQTNGWKLQKWNLAIRISPDLPWEAILPVTIICSQLLALIDAQVVRKFVVHKGKNSSSSPSFILWVFNPDLRYSSSINPNTVSRAMKIFYRRIPNPEVPLKQNSLEYEELCLPSHVLAQLHDALQGSAGILPESARKFKEWDVGLLDRFKGTNSG